MLLGVDAEPSVAAARGPRERHVGAASQRDAAACGDLAEPGASIGTPGRLLHPSEGAAAFIVLGAALSR